VSPAAHAAIERTFREEHGRVIVSLVRRFGDIDVAEEAAGEALVVALERWPVEGTPPNPGGWLTTTAGRRRSTGSAGSSGATTSIRRPG
jgi:RNA polymerase sigma-70 factor, ECF subfamily